MDGREISFLGWPIFRGELLVFREGIRQIWTSSPNGGEHK